MWIHVTGIGILKGVAGVALLMAHAFFFLLWVWFLHGMMPEQRTRSDWVVHVGLTTILVGLDVAYLWWLRDDLTALAGVLLDLSEHAWRIAS